MRMLAGALLLALLAPLTGAAPLRPGNAALMPLEGYKLHHWSLEEGSPGRINAITQTRDGFLWVGGVDGLFRFDGLTFERIGPAPTDPGRIVVARLLAARDGTLWIGLARRKGMLVWRGGRLGPAGMPNPSREVNDLAEGPDGAIWVTRGGRATRSLARWHKGRWTEFDTSSGLPERPLWHPLFASDGTLWLTGEEAVFRKAPGSDRFTATGIATLPRATLAEGPDGTIWLTEKEQTRAIARAGKGGGALIASGPAFPTPFGIRSLFDRHGDLWIATWSDGVFRFADPASPRRSEAHLTRANGLLADPVRAVFEDREGNVWIGGEMGLNMVRRVPVRPARGVPGDPATNHMLAADGAGTVYIANDQTVFTVAAGADPRAAYASPLLIEAICPQRSGAGIWIVLRGRALRWQGGRIAASYPLPGSFAANSCGEDAAGRLWLPALQKGLFVLEDGSARAWPGVEGKAHIPGNIAIMADGRAAVHFRGEAPKPDAAFAALTDSAVASDGVEGLLPGARTLYTSGAAGLAAPLVPGSPALPSSRYPWASSINGLVQTPAGETWTIGDLGVVRLRTADLTRALASPGAPVPYRLFDFNDGLTSFVQKSAGIQIVAGGDGRIWFATRDTVQMIDPATLAPDTRPPDQMIRAIAFRQQSLPAARGVRLPANIAAFAIEYTATNLAVPGRVRFRYRLGGAGADGGEWIDAGARRSASFTGLGPGDYRFELLAANADGVWSPRPAVLEFTIARAFWQTWWFRAAALVGVLGGLYLAYTIRVRQLASRMRMRMLVRTNERERIARELHDTMIQGVQGLILRFQAVADRLGDDPEVQAIVQPALERAEEVLVEGRERVTELRSPRHRDFPEELARLAGNPIFPQARIAPLAITGTPRAIAPGLIDDLLAVLGEALGNAAAHSRANRIEIALRFGRWSFVAQVRDNGIGMAEGVIAEGAAPGHFGLVGMKERIEALGGRFVVESAHGFGTVIELAIPARIAYARAPTGQRPPRAGMT
ncbi:MAG: histidine kinase [Erythrobacter sp.]|uniref:sensor histidine kinase n=1 Tax=Erythrobacter sp. TaxID=1042 RepID=UPI0025DF0E84|nr:sensor histidine kinase [Erythrobacter sp.]MCL9998845.1 histidine kinase [Erythrobacter sp.]